MKSIDRPPVSGRDSAPDGEAASAQRAGSRDSLFLMGRLTLGDESQPRDVRIRNLSEGGLMIEIGRPIALDMTLTLNLRGIGDVTGRVAWCAEGRVGIALDRPIDPMLARKPVGGGKRTPRYAKPATG